MINRIADAFTTAAGRWRWRKAHNLTDLANLQADRITRIQTRLAKDGYSPHPTMYSTLVALGRAGMVVTDWRPGTSTTISDPDTLLETRASMTGFADDETKDWLDNLLYYAGQEPGVTKYTLASVYELYGPGCIEYDRWPGSDDGRCRGHAAERINGTVTARIGGQMDAKQVYRTLPTGRGLQQELREAWQVTICAPTWGDGRMFADLLPLLGDNRRPATA